MGYAHSALNNAKPVQEGELMPKTAKGKKIQRAMTKTYGAKKGKQVFYASRNKGTIKGVDRPRTALR